jgi:hypothetical protein
MVLGIFDDKRKERKEATVFGVVYYYLLEFSHLWCCFQVVGRVTPAKRPLDSSGESVADKNGEGGATSGFTVKRMRIISESESENGSPNKVSQVGVK